VRLRDPTVADRLRNQVMPPIDTLLRGRSRSDGLSEDTIFSILSNERRRYVLHYLDRVEPEAELSDLTEQVAAWENGVDVADLTYDQRKRVYTSLHQTHLPKLDDAGVVDYDRDRGTVAVAAGAADLDAYLSAVGDGGRRWSRRYLTLSALCLVAFAAARFGAAPFAAAPELALAAAVAVAFGLSAAVHAWLSRSDGVDVAAHVRTDFDSDSETD
jgi:DNA-binding transcriptional ArsR family regulator